MTRQCLISRASVLAAVLIQFATAYPVIFQVDESSDRCFRFNIPEGEEAHLVAVVIPNEDEVDNDETLESWYVDQVFALTKDRTRDQHVLKKEFTNELSSDVAQKMSNYLRDHGGDDSHLLVQITGTPASDPKNYHHKLPTRYFKPTILNYVGATTDVNAGRYHKPEYHVNLEGYGVCLTNTHHSRHVQVVFDLVLTSDEIPDDDDVKDKGRFTKEKHLTPLEQSLDQSINAANVVLREMNYMEKREARMRKTAESINTRVRWFSYLSVSVLLSVTYIQVTYLKRYFHKKKLM